MSSRIAFAVILPLLVATCSQVNREDDALSSANSESANEIPETAEPGNQGLVVLSDLYGICAPATFLNGIGGWRTSRSFEFSGGELTFRDDAGLHKISFSAGGVSVPGVSLTDLESDDAARRMAIGEYDSVGVVVVFGLSAGGHLKLWIEYQKADSIGRTVAMQLAREVIECDVAERLPRRAVPE